MGPNHEEVEMFHPKVANEVPAYLQQAAEKGIRRMLDGGLLEEVTGYSKHVSRGFFVTKNTKEGEEVNVRLVADYRGVNRKLQRPGQPLENAWGILKRLNPRHRYFGAIDFTSGYSQIPLDEGSRNLFTIITPYGKFRPTVLPQGTSINPEVFYIGTAEEIRNTEDCWKNADDVLGGGIELEDLDVVTRRVFAVCRRRGIKLSPSKLQIGEGSNGEELLLRVLDKLKETIK